MSAFRKNLVSWHRITRVCAFLVIFACTWDTAIAQAPKAPYASFDQAILTGSGNTINATQIPVVTATGVVVYVNATLQFNVDANGNLTLASGYPQISPAPTLLTAGFKAGKYVGPTTILGGKAIINVTGPGVTDGGATMWSVSTPTGADPNTYPGSATWYVGPLANNPNASRIMKAGITSTALSYGIGGNPNTSGYNWAPGNLIGVSQTGNTITFFSFSNRGDSSIPLDQITYTLSPTP